jgi:UDP-N-acetylmuramate: L-alanyl-gamma-D-glutamyl-meso-diaminopimelate ligase
MQKREHIHLLGIGGVGMASLAGLLKESGAFVTGSDLELYSPMREMLEEMSIRVQRDYSEKNLDPIPDMVVIGNVIKRGNPEAEYILDHHLDFCSMPVMIRRRFLKGKKAIVVAGTHGKTTTASLISWIYSSAGKDPSYLVGGIPKNFGKSYHLGSGKHFIVEGDEYETSFFDKGPKFMHYLPDTLILGAVEYDHADIYRSLEEVILQFKRLVHIVPRSGKIIAYGDNDNIQEVLKKNFSECELFGIGESCFWRIEKVKYHKGWMEFELYRGGRFLRRFRTRLYGYFNVLNATAAIAASFNDSLDLDAISMAMESFEGTRRRLDMIGYQHGIKIFDDFAHHPTSVKGTLRTLREIHEGGTIWAVFEPRSWSLRRNVFKNDLVDAFDSADAIIIAPVYKADQIRQRDRLDVTDLAHELNRKGKRAYYIKGGVDQIIQKLIEELREGDVVVIMSNGSFDHIYDKLLDKLSKRR